MEIYLIRHTTPKIEKGICYGQSDIPLADSFSVEANNLLQHLPEQIDAAYTSSSGRCQKLASLIKPGLPLITDKRLMEMNFGEWEMKKWDEINQPELTRWMQDFVNVKVPQGENCIEMNDRVNSFIDELIKQDHKSVIIVTHAGVIRSFVARVLDIPLKNIFKIPVDYSSITKIDISSDNCFGSLKMLNKTALNS